MKRGKVFKITISAIGVAILAVLLLTCPGRRAHREAIIDAIGNDIVEKANLNSLGDAAKSLKYASYGLYNSAVNPCLRVMGYGLFSIGYINTGKEPEKKISFGILGHVFIKEKENIHRKFPLLAEPMPVAPEPSPENQK